MYRSHLKYSDEHRISKTEEGEKHVDQVGISYAMKYLTEIKISAEISEKSNGNISYLALRIARALNTCVENQNLDTLIPKHKRSASYFPDNWKLLFFQTY